MTKKSPALFWLTLVSLLLAVGTHIYLINHHYNLKYGSEIGEALCNINDYMNCDATSASSFSEFLGIPMALLGALLNFFLLGLLCSYQWPVASEKFRNSLPSSIKLTALLIFSASLVMGFLSITVVKSLCPACLATYALSFITLVGCWAYLKGSLSLSAFEFKLIPGLLLATLTFGFFFNKVQVSKYGGQDLNDMNHLSFLDWKEQSPVTINPVSPLEYNKKAGAKMHIVEFADFLCGHCKTAFPKIHSFVKAHPDAHLSFQAFPLDGCLSDETPQCYLARLAYCGGQQGRGWETQKWIFDHQRELLRPQLIDEKLTDLGIYAGVDTEAMKTCAEAEETRNVIKEQMEVGKNIGVKGTPSVYVNGKKVPMVSIPVLKKIHGSL